MKAQPIHLGGRSTLRDVDVAPPADDASTGVGTELSSVEAFANRFATTRLVG
jgi:hypothetical protein